MKLPGPKAMLVAPTSASAVRCLGRCVVMRLETVLFTERLMRLVLCRLSDLTKFVSCVVRELTLQLVLLRCADLF